MLKIQAENESTLKALTNDCDGVFGTLKQAIAELGIPRIKLVRPVPSYKGQLTLGDLETFDTALAIDIERYPRTMIAKPPSATQFVERTGEAANGEDSVQSSHTLAPDSGTVADGNTAGILMGIKNSRIYQVDDENIPGAKREVVREELAKGYEYGRTAVHISESDENVTTLETRASMTIVGFVQKDMVRGLPLLFHTS